MQHVEFFHPEHFEYRYHRKKPRKSLGGFIDFFWETNFEPLYDQYPEGFSDALFPNVGYTYLINLGTPFVMQLEDESYEMRSDGFLPRHKNMVCHHTRGNKIFGIKFRVSPVIFEKKINFSEYREYIFPLSYLMDGKVLEAVKKADRFEKRVALVSDYYEKLIEKHTDSLKPVTIVTQILSECVTKHDFHISIEELARRYNISSRTLQRYFEATTSITSKQALQILRIRMAIEKLTGDPAHFNCQDFGYYDYSHFYKHLRQFLRAGTISILQPHLRLLKGHMP